MFLLPGVPAGAQLVHVLAEKPAKIQAFAWFQT